MSNLTQVTNKKYSGAYGVADFAVELCAEGFRLDEALNAAVKKLLKLPKDKETLNIYHTAVEAYFIHRRGIWSKSQQRYIGACPHCRVYTMPRWVGTGKEEA